MIYFAYGSNMLASRLRKRIAAEDLGVAALSGWRLVFNKPSQDGSGKVNIARDATDRVLGVLYRIDPADIQSLDAAEYGYERMLLPVEADGCTSRAQVYVWTRDTPELALYRWYLDMVIDGALEHELPPQYVQRFHRVPVMSDPTGPIPPSRS